MDDFSFRGQGGLLPTKLKSSAHNGWKVVYIKIAAILLAAFVFISLINLEIVNGASYKKLADANRIYIESAPAPRGIIYDRNGVPLVYNTDIFKVTADPSLNSLPGKESILAHLAVILGITPQSLILKYEKSAVNGGFIDLADNITKEQMIEISSSTGLKGIRVEPGIQRSYPYGSVLSHVLGYTGQVTANDIQAHSGYTLQDTIGKTGIEYEYDKQLRGVDGENIVEVDTLGNVISTIKTISPIPGNNIYLSIDINVQKQLMADLQQGINKSKTIGGYGNTATGGAAIVENTNDGSILAMTSLPTFDNNLFAQGISVQDYNTLLNNSADPLINRSISEAQPPGSIMKTITAPAALQEGAITPDTIFNDRGTFQFGGHTYQNYDRIARGRINVIGGLQWSSNIFFYNTILALGINNLVKYEQLFGVGTHTGIDLPGEVSGQIFSPQEKQQRTGQVWYGGDSLNAAIGQGDTEVTPMQVVNWITSIANGGTLFTPHLLYKIDDPLNESSNMYTAHVIRQKFVSPQNLSLVKQGMYTAVHSGIDITLNSDKVSVGGKTGTAEFGALDSQGNYTHAHAWASGFAPFNHPQIAFVVFVENGGFSTTAEFAAKNFLNWYFGSYLSSHPGVL